VLCSTVPIWTVPWSGPDVGHARRYEAGSVSTPYEPYRARIAARTPNGDATTVTVTRQSGHRAGRVWLSLHCAWRGTVCLTDGEVDEVTAMMIETKAVRINGEGYRESTREGYLRGGGPMTRKARSLSLRAEPILYVAAFAACGGRCHCLAGPRTKPGATRLGNLRLVEIVMTE